MIRHGKLLRRPPSGAAGVRPRRLGSQSQPGPHRRFHDCQLSVIQFAKLTNQFRVWNRDEVLGIEYASAQKPDRHFGFEL